MPPCDRLSVPVPVSYSVPPSGFAESRLPAPLSGIPSVYHPSERRFLCIFPDVPEWSPAAVTHRFSVSGHAGWEPLSVYRSVQASHHNAASYLWWMPADSGSRWFHSYHPLCSDLFLLYSDAESPVFLLLLSLLQQICQVLQTLCSYYLGSDCPDLFPDLFS